MATFRELGIPFPLFQAPAEHASEYHGVARCSLCRAGCVHVFEAGIGAGVVVECSSCHTTNALDAYERFSSPCRVCHILVSFPPIDDSPILACYACLRSTRVVLTKDSELGMISWEQAFEGVTHGVPGLKRTDFELVERDKGWVGVRLSTDIMFELLRTPTYSTIQGDQWQFCCRTPMVFLGTWERGDFARHAPDGDGRAFFESIVVGEVPGLWEDQLHDVTGVYVFGCRVCSHRAHWDIA